MWPGGFETIVATKSGQRYEVLYLPDLHNDDLQAEGKAPVYYWLPNGVRIARAGDTGDFKFHLIHFEGVMSPDTTTGVTAPSEVAGGVLAFTVTCAPPLDVLEASHQQIKDRLRGDGRRYWGWRTPSEPQFAPVPISDSRTHMSNLSPRLDGTVPSSQPASGGPGGPTPTGGGAPGGPGAPGAPKSTVATRSLAPRLVRNNVPVRANRDVTPTGLDAWYMRIEGEGPGSLNPAGENAYVALCGSLPTAILWAGFHGTYSPVVVSQTLNLKVWSETLRIHIHGDWDRVFTHFSAAAQGRAWWFSADIKTEFNNLRINGGIKVEVEIDGTNPGADKMKEEVDKRIDLIVNKFTEEAKARIFDPAPPDVKPAEAQQRWAAVVDLRRLRRRVRAEVPARRDQADAGLRRDPPGAVQPVLDDLELAGGLLQPDQGGPGSGAQVLHDALPRGLGPQDHAQHQARGELAGSGPEVGRRAGGLPGLPDRLPRRERRHPVDAARVPEHRHGHDDHVATGLRQEGCR